MKRDESTPARLLPVETRKLVAGIRRLSRRPVEEPQTDPESAAVDEVVQAILALRVFDLRKRSLERSLFRRTVGTSLSRARASCSNVVQCEERVGETPDHILARIAAEVRRRCSERGMQVKAREIERALGLVKPGGDSPEDLVGRTTR